MDAINRFTGLRSIPIPQEMEVSAEQASIQSSNAGIAGTSDSFEMVQPLTANLTNLATPVTTGDTENPSQGEIIDASSFFDLIGSDMGKLPATGADQIQEELDGQGIVDWDAIASLKAEMAKMNPDEVAMIQILEKLPADDLAATLAALESRGNPSDLKLMLHQVFTNDDASKRLSPMLVSLASDKNLPASQTKLLDKIFPMISMEKGAPMVVCDMIRTTRGQGILPKLSLESTTSMYQILHSHPNLQNTLFEHALYQETQRRPIDGLRNPDQMPMDGSTPEAMRDFPEWGINKLSELNKTEKLDIAVQNLRGRETDFLAEFCRCGSKAENILTEYIKSYQRDRRAGFTTGDLIRSIVMKLKESAVSTLSQFSPAFLTDLKGILLAGTAADLAVLSKVIEPALNAATKREAVTDGVKQSAQDVNKNIPF